MNQNFYRGWQASQGVEVFDSDGLLAVQVSGEWDGVVELRFLPRTLWGGLLLSGLGLVLCFGLLGWGRRRQSSDS